MDRRLLIPAAYVLDQVAGDPEWLPHPVRLMGSLITRGEATLRRSGQSAERELFSGALLTTFLVVGTYYTTRQLLRAANASSPTIGAAAEIVLASTCLAASNLQDEARTVTDALETGDLEYARVRLARIVGRDTAQLSAQEISRAVIETVAESASDGVIAPLFYMALGGVPLAMAYKAGNTLDSMIGHADARYFYFGKAAARLDDLANFLPARLTALGVVAAASMYKSASAHEAWQTWLEDGGKHKSPNAGQPESAMSGALRVQLGGANTYAGEFIPAEIIGAKFPPPTSQDATQSIRMIAVVSLLGAAVATIALLFASSEQRR